MNASENTILWIHGDSLSPYHPILQARPEAPAVFVWDEELLDAWGITLKRIVFMYECLLELPVVIRRGDVVDEVVGFAAEHRAKQVLTAASPSPRHRLFCERIEARLPAGGAVHVLAEEPFVPVKKPLDLKRFSRYWRAVRKQALHPE